MLRQTSNMETKQPTLESLIEKNKFDWVNPNITSKNFPLQGKVEPVEEILYFNEIFSTDEILKRLDERGYRPVTVYELLTWSQKSWNGKDFVVALGSVWRDADGFRYVACLYRDASGRGLGLGWVGSVWRTVCRFAAVRKSLDTETISPHKMEEEHG